MNKKILGHIMALFAVFVWSTTLVSTKILLRYLQPLEILVIRFITGFIVLNIIYPKRIRWLGIKNELTFAATGFFGIFLYFMLDNYSLKFTMASNVGIIMSVTPFLTAIMSWMILKENVFHIDFIVGFIIAVAGVALISINGRQLELNPFGDFLALLGGISWSVYSVLLKKTENLKLPAIAVTRRCIMYGLVFLIPAYFVIDGELHIGTLKNGKVIGNILFLGLLASSLCFVAWTKAVSAIGLSQTAVYIYLGPFITLAASFITLHEPVTKLSLAGIAMTFLGMLISNGKFEKRKNHRMEMTYKAEKTGR